MVIWKICECYNISSFMCNASVPNYAYLYFAKVKKFQLKKYYENKRS